MMQPELVCVMLLITVRFCSWRSELRDSCEKESEDDAVEEVDDEMLSRES